MDNYNSPHKIQAELFIYYKNNLRKQITKETGFWSEMNQSRLYNKFVQSDQRLLQLFMENHIAFTQNECPANLLIFLMIKAFEVENWLHRNMDPAIYAIGTKYSFGLYQ